MKKILSAAIALMMMMAMFVPAFAEDGVAPAAPAGGTAAVTSSDGTTWVVANDDDEITSSSDHETNINVWAEVKDNGTSVYKVDLTWGEMKFEFNSGTKWNVDTHTYTAVEGVTAGWQVNGYLDGTNNRIIVTNHSNEAIEATFAYAMADTNIFNTDASINNTTRVVGNFFEDNTAAVTAAGVSDVSTVAGTITGNKITVASADNGTEGGAGTPVTEDVFFAFSGIPDSGKGADLADFTKVGVITVTIAVAAVG